MFYKELHFQTDAPVIQFPRNMYPTHSHTHKPYCTVISSFSFTLTGHLNQSLKAEIIRRKIHIMYPKVWTNLLTTFLLILKGSSRLLISFFFTLTGSVCFMALAEQAIAVLYADREAAYSEAIWRSFLSQRVIRPYMAVRHTSLLPDTQGQFPHWDHAFLKIKS